MYRKTSKYAEKYARMRAAKERKRLSGPAPDYPPDLPELRRLIIVEDYDGSETIRHELVLYRTDRIDCYRVVADGKEWKERVGWSKILAGLRKAMPRVRSIWHGTMFIYAGSGNAIINAGLSHDCKVVTA